MLTLLFGVVNDAVSFLQVFENFEGFNKLESGAVFAEVCDVFFLAAG